MPARYFTAFKIKIYCEYAKFLIEISKKYVKIYMIGLLYNLILTLIRKGKEICRNF